MLTPQDLVAAFARNVSIVHSQTVGFTHAESLLQLPFQGNCMNWVVGHLADNRDLVLETLGGTPLFRTSSAPYRRGSEELDIAGPEVQQLEDLLAALDSSQAQITEVLGAMADADMAREFRQGERVTTIGARVFFLYFHETYHVGQTELLRQLAGKNDKII